MSLSTGDVATPLSLISLAGVLAWADCGRAELDVLAGVLVGGVIDDRGASAMLRLWAIVKGLQLRELLLKEPLCISSVLQG